MKRVLALLTAGALAALALAIPASAGIEIPITVEKNGENRFGPGKVTADLGGSVFSWTWADAPTNREHNVRQDKRLFRSGDPTSDPDTPGDSFFRSVSAGTYHYYCENHGSPTGGMDGKIRVRPISPNPPDPGDQSFPVRWAIGPEAALGGAKAARRWAPQGPTETGDRFDVRFKVDGGHWRTWKEDTSKVQAQFGRNDNPVHVRNGKEYKLQARSQKGSNDAKVSGWSPSLTIVGGVVP